MKSTIQDEMIKRLINMKNVVPYFDTQHLSSNFKYDCREDKYHITIYREPSGIKTVEI